MATKPVSISPLEARAAGCTANCESYYRYPPVDDGSGYVEFYQITASPARGWKVKRATWNIVQTYPGDVDPSPHETDTLPYPPTQDPDAASAYAAYDFESRWPIDGHLLSRWEMQDVEVEFERSAHVPTHLPVDSSNLAAPVRIVHYGASNLPVADF